MSLALVPSGPTVRTIARQQGIDLAKLIEILSWRRPDGSEHEVDFVRTFLDPIAGMAEDDFGNRYMVIGDNPTVMWSCHTDTVSDEGGFQNVKWDGDVLCVNEAKMGQTLGADDGAGLWLMLEMIKAERPGLYIFHRAEEVGGLGSRDIVNNRPELVDGIKMAIAFDRKATYSVITFQRGQRCCSNKFGEALAAKLNLTEGLDYRLDEGGVFTDTANYTKLIPECTNLSAGYYDEHTSGETLDVAHLFRLRTALLTLDVTDLPIERDPSKVESRYPSYGSYGYGYSSGGNRSYGRSGFSSTGDPELDQIWDLVRDFPLSTAKWIRKCGITSDMFEELLDALTPPKPKPEPLTNDEAEKAWKEYLAARPAGPDPDEEEMGEVEEQDVLYCNDCDQMTSEEDMRNYAIDGEACAWCYSNNTSVTQALVNYATGEVVDA